MFGNSSRFNKTLAEQYQSGFLSSLKRHPDDAKKNMFSSFNEAPKNSVLKNTDLGRRNGGLNSGFSSYA